MCIVFIRVIVILARSTTPTVPASVLNARIFLLSLTLSYLDIVRMMVGGR